VFKILNGGENIDIKDITKDGIQLDRYVGLSISLKTSMSTCHLELIR